MEMSSNPTITDNSSYTIRDRTNGPIGQINSYHGHMISSANPIRNDHFTFDYEVFSREYDASLRCVLEAAAIRHRQQMAEKWGHLQPQMAYSSSYRDRINGPIGQTNVHHGHVMKRSTDYPQQIPSANPVCNDHFLINGQDEKLAPQSVHVSNHENIASSKRSNIGEQYHGSITSIEDMMVKIEDTTANDTMADVEDTRMKIEVTAAGIKQPAEGKFFVFILIDDCDQNESPTATIHHDFISDVINGTIHCKWLLGAHDLRVKSKWLVKKFNVTRLTCARLLQRDGGRHATKWYGSLYFKAELEAELVVDMQLKNPWYGCKIMSTNRP